MSTRVTHRIGPGSLVVAYDERGAGEFHITGYDGSQLTPEWATQLRHHLTVWLEARPVTQFGMGGPIVMRGDGHDMQRIDAEQTKRYEQSRVAVERAFVSAAVLIEKLNADETVGDAAKAALSCAIEHEFARPRWSSTPPTEPGWYWLDVPTLTGARIVEVQVSREGDWWTVTGPKVAASWQTGMSAHEWGWKWWSERLTPPQVPHG